MTQTWHDDVPAGLIIPGEIIPENPLDRFDWLTYFTLAAPINDPKAFARIIGTGGIW